MPHGLASGFTLPELLRFNAGAAPERIDIIANAMNTDGVDSAHAKLIQYFADWGVSPHVRKHLDEVKARSMESELLTPGRADNNVRPATHEDALGIVLRSL